MKNLVHYREIVQVVAENPDSSRISKSTLRELAKLRTDFQFEDIIRLKGTELFSLCLPKPNTTNTNNTSSDQQRLQNNSFVCIGSQKKTTFQYSASSKQ